MEIPSIAARTSVPFFPHPWPAPFTEKLIQQFLCTLQLSCQSYFVHSPLKSPSACPAVKPSFRAGARGQDLPPECSRKAQRFCFVASLDRLESGRFSWTGRLTFSEYAKQPSQPDNTPGPRPHLQGPANPLLPQRLREPRQARPRDYQHLPQVRRERSRCRENQILRQKLCPVCLWHRGDSEIGRRRQVRPRGNCPPTLGLQTPQSIRLQAGRTSPRSRRSVWRGDSEKA